MGINELIEKAGLYYSFGESASLPFSSQSRRFDDTITGKSLIIPKWQIALKEIQNKIPLINVRDFSYEHEEPSISAQFSISSTQGFSIYLSLLIPYIGFCYCDYQNKTPQLFPVHPIFDRRQILFLSYSPFNKEQGLIADKVSNIMLQFFPNHTNFTAEQACIELEKVIISGLPYNHVQIFNLFFSHHLNGII